ncbi:MAG: general secretion pathway protein GspB [Woeseiaceae bacterium]
MSFILDALKKSETERQQQAGAEFAAVPSGDGAPKSFKWLWLLIGLLAVNFAVLAGLLLRPAAIPVAPATTPATEAEPPAAAGADDMPPSFEEQVARAREREADRNAERAAGNEAGPGPAVAAGEPVRQPQTQARSVEPTPASSAAGDSAMLPRFDELRAEGVLQLPDLHLDIHVYSDVPKERFVFINMNKLREGQKLDEGPVVQSITPAGVVLRYQGRSFLLPRE